MAAKVTRSDPPYIQIVSSIRHQIESGKLQPGDPIPSIRKVMDEYGVSNATAVKALGALKAEGLTEAREGVGTTVKKPRTLTTGPDRLRMLRATGSGLRTEERVEILSAELVVAPKNVAEALEVEEGSQVVRRQRAYYDNQGIVSLSTSYLPPQFSEAAPELLSTEPLPKMTFGLIEERVGLRPEKQRDIVAIKHIPDQVAPLLEAEAGTPTLTMTNHYWAQTGKPTEYAVDYLGVGRVLSAEYEL